VLNRVELLHWPPGLDAAAQAAWLQALRATSAPPDLLQPTLPGAYHGGDVLRRRRVATPALELAATIDGPQDAALFGEGEAGGDWSGPGIYRVLLLALRPAVPAAAVARFERELLAMPRYIGAIRAWRLSRVLQAGGARAWTHVWEQRYECVEALTGPYMLHPYHWAHVDRWFDPESPDWIVDTRLCHSYCRIAPTPAAPAHPSP